jgi:hypothetical protein
LAGRRRWTDGHIPASTDLPDLPADVARARSGAGRRRSEERRSVGSRRGGAGERERRRELDLERHKEDRGDAGGAGEGEHRRGGKGSGDGSRWGLWCIM